MFATCSVPPKSEVFGRRFGGEPQREEADQEACQVHQDVCRVADHRQAPGDLPTCETSARVTALLERLSQPDQTQDLFC